MGVSQSKDENMEEESQYIPARITLTPQTQGYDSQDRGVGGTWGDDSRTMTGGPEIVDGEVRTTAQAAMQVDENYATSYEDGNRSVTLPGNVGVNDVDGESRRFLYTYVLSSRILIVLTSLLFLYSNRSRLQILCLLFSSGKMGVEMFTLLVHSTIGRDR